MAREKGDVLQGTLDMLVLKALQLEPMHGWGIAKRIQQWSENVLQVGQGTLYPSLYRLEHQGLIRSEWATTENNRRARYYTLPGRGAGSCATSSVSGSACPVRSTWSWRPRETESGGARCTTCGAVCGRSSVARPTTTDFRRRSASISTTRSRRTCVRV